MAHIESMIDDYLLNLLTAKERSFVEQHAAACPRCRNLLAEERRRTTGLIASLHETFAPPAGRLELLWPGVAAAAGLVGSEPRPQRRPAWRLQWRPAVAAMALALAILVGLLGTGRRFDSWLIRTDTPATASQTASPTASLTPTWTRPSISQGSIALVHLDRTNYDATGTPEPLPSADAPEPQPNPSAPTASGQRE